MVSLRETDTIEGKLLSIKKYCRYSKEDCDYLIGDEGTLAVLRIKNQQYVHWAPIYIDASLDYLSEYMNRNVKFVRTDNVENGIWTYNAELYVNDRLVLSSHVQFTEEFWTGETRDTTYSKCDVKVEIST